MDFALFIALNAVLLIRPEDFIPEVTGAHLYLILIIANLLVALPKFLNRLRPAELAKRPITVCALGLVAAAGLSHLAHGRITAAYEFVADFAKVIVYFLLLVAVLDSPSRLRTFLGFLVALIIVVAGLGLLQFHEYIDYDALRPIMQPEYSAEEGGEIYVARLCGPGVYNDPNDMCLVLTLGVVCCLARAATAANLLTTGLWLAPIGLYGYAIVETRSRGGLLGLMAALASLLVAKFGWRRALPVALLGLPAILLAIGGRQANINLGSSDTARERVMIWAEGIKALTDQPIYMFTGIGAGELEESTGQVSHNSFVHSYVEMGLLGGSLFLAAFVLAGRMLFSLRPAKQPDLPSDLAALQPFVFALLIGGAVGIYSLSRNYHVSTYMYLALAEAFGVMALADPPAAFRVSWLWLKQTVLTGAGGFAFLKFFTQFAGSLG
jgi:O-antigen ligase